MSKLLSYFKELFSRIPPKAFAIAEHSRFDIKTTGDYQYFTSPIDGWVKFQISSNPTELSRYRLCSYSADTIELIAYTSFKSTTGVSDVTIPIRKGQQFGFIANSGLTATIKYCSL